VRRVLGPGQDALVGQLAQPGGEHAARHAQVLLELVEPPGAAEGVANDQQRPPLADHVERPGD